MKKSEIIKFFDAQRAVILTTMNGDVPETRALTNIRNRQVSPYLVEYFDKNDRMLLVTATTSDKIQQIRKNPVAVLYAFDSGAQAIMLSGKTFEVLDTETKNIVWSDSFISHFPAGRDGGDFSVLEFIPETYKLYGGKEKGSVE